MVPSSVQHRNAVRLLHLPGRSRGAGGRRALGSTTTLCRPLRSAGLATGHRLLHGLRGDVHQSLASAPAHYQTEAGDKGTFT